MPNLKSLGLLATLPALALAVPAPATAQDTGKTCKVTVDRSQPAGTYDVQRQELENGDCICYVYTGPQPQSDQIESSIAGLLSSRTCPTATPVAVPSAGAAGGSGGGISGAALGLGGLAAAGAAAAALSGGDGGSDSP